MLKLLVKSLTKKLVELEAERGDENFYFTLTKEELLELISQLPDEPIRVKLEAR